MLRRHLLMAGTAIALTAAMVGSALADPIVLRIVAGDLVPDDPASENYIKNIEAGVNSRKRHTQHGTPCGEERARRIARHPEVALCRSHRDTLRGAIGSV